MVKTKLALKRLTASDLTLFEWHFRNRNAGNQKAINLNRDVFIDQLYPALPDAVVEAEQEGKLPLDLTIIGPDGKGELNLQRKIVKFGAYKNWRLNGEFIHNPSAEPQRFNELRPDDLVLIEFSGRVVPTSARMILVGTQYANDIDLHQALNKLLHGQKMITLTQDQLTKTMESAKIPPHHPVRLLAVDEVIEDAAQGGVVSMEKLWKGVARQRLSQEALQKARRNAEDVGRLGEEIVNAHLERKLTQGEILGFEWTSAENAVAPYDFKVRDAAGETLFDVKATAGDFSRKLHISMNELRQMANGSERYDLWRLYAIDGFEARARVATDMRNFAKSLLDALKNLPAGISPDGFTVDPGGLGFGREIVIKGLDDED